MKIALLSAEGLFLGLSDDMSAPGIEVPDECDLVPGRYRHDGKAFMPVAPEPLARSTEQVPDAERAIFKALRSIQRSGLVKFDRETVDWIDAYSKTLDAAG